MPTDFEKRLFDYQDKFRTTFRDEYLSEIFLLIKDYCKILFHYKKYDYDEDIATDIAEELTMGEIFKGKFIRKSWKSYLLCRIDHYVSRKFFMTPIYECLSKIYDDKFINKEEALLERIEGILNKFMTTLDVSEKMLFLLYLKRQVTDSVKDYTDKYLARTDLIFKYKKVKTLWELAFRGVLS